MKLVGVISIHWMPLRFVGDSWGIMSAYRMLRCSVNQTNAALTAQSPSLAA